MWIMWKYVKIYTWNCLSFWQWWSPEKNPLKIQWSWHHWWSELFTSELVTIYYDINLLNFRNLGTVINLATGYPWGESWHNQSAQNVESGSQLRHPQPTCLLVKFGSSSVFPIFGVKMTMIEMCVYPHGNLMNLWFPIPATKMPSTTSYGTSGDHWASDKHGSRLCSKSWVGATTRNQPRVRFRSKWINEQVINST